MKKVENHCFKQTRTVFSHAFYEDVPGWKNLALLSWS